MASNNMSDIKRRIKSINSTEHITNAMKLVSAAKLRKAKNTFDRTNQYSRYIIESITDILNDTTDIPQKYLEGSNSAGKNCYIIITSGRGLCGSFNTNVIKEAELRMEADTGEAILVPIGLKGKEYFEKRGMEIYTSFLEPTEDIPFSEARRISRLVIDLYERGVVDSIMLVYTSFINNLEQKAVCEQLLPFVPYEDEDAHPVDKEVEYGPSMDAVFNYLIPKYIEMLVYGAIVESATCEHAARRIAMENATDNARDILGKLSLTYNRARQAAITNEIIEVVSGSEAQK
ncbi:MAG: ATP synthase F1 subunit gamma [Clostridiales bacterium]|nr:ATP synthase F1 subunit gamma [Clostridiales bacterium]